MTEISEAKEKLDRASRFRPYLISGGITVAVLVGVFVVWGGTAELDSAVIAPGEIKSESNVKSVAHLEGGIIHDIVVRDGDRVASGDLLLRLDQTIDKANYSIVRDEMLELEAKKARLVAELGSADAPNFGAIADQTWRTEHYDDVVARQTEMFETRKQRLQNDMSLYDKRQARFRDEIDGLTREKQANLNQVDLIHDELEDLRGLQERGLTTRSRLLALEREAERLNGEVAALDTAIARSYNAIDENEIEKSGLLRAHLQEVSTELEAIEPRLQTLREQSVAALRKLELIEIRAPVDGTIVGLTAHTIGGVLPPGETVLNIVPEDDQLVIEVHVTPLDIERVLVGQEARVRLSTFNQTTTPEALARVTKVSADSFTDERTGQSYYKATLKLHDEQPEGIPIDDLLPGMVAETFILTGERTALAYLIQPLEARIARSLTEE